MLNYVNAYLPNTFSAKPGSLYTKLCPNQAQLPQQRNASG